MHISSLDEIHSDHLVLPCTITGQNKHQIKTSAMIDSGATGTAFVDSSFVQDNNLKINLLPQPLRLRVVDGRPSSAGDITTTTTFALDIKGHTETLTAFVTKLHNYNIILGKPWLRKHNPSNIDWDSNVLSFNSNFCKTHCLPQACHQIAISGRIIRHRG